MSRWNNFLEAAKQKTSESLESAKRFTDSAKSKTSQLTDSFVQSASDLYDRTTVSASNITKEYSDFKEKRQEKAAQQALEEAKALSAKLQTLHDQLKDDIALAGTLIQALEEQTPTTDQKNIHQQVLKQLRELKDQRSLEITENAQHLLEAKGRLLTEPDYSIDNFGSTYINTLNAQATQALEKVFIAHKPLLKAIAQAQTLRFRLIFDKEIGEHKSAILQGLTHPDINTNIINAMLNDGTLITTTFDVFKSITIPKNTPEKERKKYDATVQPENEPQKKGSIAEYIYRLNQVHALAKQVAYKYEQHWNEEKPVKKYEGTDLEKYMNALQNERRSFSLQKTILATKYPNLPDPTVLNNALTDDTTGLFTFIIHHFKPEIREQERKAQEKQFQQQLREKKAELEQLTEELESLNRETGHTVNTFIFPSSEKHFDDENSTEAQLYQTVEEIKQKQKLLVQLKQLKVKQKEDAEQRQREEQERQKQEQEALEQKAVQLEQQRDQLMHQVSQLKEELGNPKINEPALKASTKSPAQNALTLDDMLEQSTLENTPEGRVDSAERVIEQQQEILKQLQAIQKQRQQAAAPPKQTTHGFSLRRPQQNKGNTPAPAQATQNAPTTRQPDLSTPVIKAPIHTTSSPPAANSPRQFVFKSTTLEQRVKEKVVRQYDTDTNKKYYANQQGFTMSGKPSTTSLWKKLAPRNKTRDNMVDFVNQIAKSNVENKETLLYTALMVVKRSIEAQKPKYTSTLWCIAKELTDHKSGAYKEDRQALSQFWSENKAQYKKWDVDEALRSQITLKSGF